MLWLSSYPGLSLNDLRSFTYRLVLHKMATRTPRGDTSCTASSCPVAAAPPDQTGCTLGGFPLSHKAPFLHPKDASPNEVADYFPSYQELMLRQKHS